MKNLKHSSILYHNPKFVLIACMLLLGATTQYANATPAGWTVSWYHGNPLFTTDTGMQWLSPVASAGLSYNQMTAYLADEASIYYGFRRGSSEEVYSLLTAYGFTNVPCYPDRTQSDFDAAVNDLFPDFGITYCVHEGITLGLMGWIDFPNFIYAEAHDIAPKYTPFAFTHIREDIDPDPDMQSSSRGTWLIRETPNQAPVADAGPGQTVEQASADGTEVTLDGSGSSDPDGDALTYLWTWDGGNTTGVSPTVLFPQGTTDVTLVVNDGAEDSLPDHVSITVQDTTPPELTCPEDVTVEQETLDGTVVSLVASAMDLCDADVEITSDEPDVYPLGSTVVTLTATDDSGNSSTGQTVVTVVDTTPPELTCPAEVTVEQETLDGAVVSLIASATDICDADIEITSDEPDVYPLGSTTVTFTATDDSGNSSTGQTVVTVVDTTPPEIELSEPEPSVLWPVNHKFVDVMIMGFALDICDAELDLSVSVEVIDAEGGDGGPEHDPDYGEPIVQIDGEGLLTILVALRAESSGEGTGRIYEITAVATDDSGNTASAMTQVTVPHDQGKGGKK